MSEVIRVKYDTKVLEVPGVLKTIGVAGDNNARSLTFCIERTPDNINLDDCTVEVIYQNANREIGRRVVTNPTVDRAHNTVTFNFLIPSSLTSYRGTVYIGLAIHKNNGVIWKVAPGTFYVENAIDESAAENAELDLYRQVEQALRDLDLSEQNTTALTLKNQLTTLNGSAGTLYTNLTNTVNTGTTLKNNLSSATTTANNAKTNLDSSISTGTTLKSNLDGSVATANAIKTALDESIANGDVATLREDFLATKGTLCEEITNIAVKKTATGSFIHLDDSAEYPISEIVIYGKSTQAGTPSVENPVPIESVSSGVLVAGNKNLFNVDDLPNQSWAQNLIGASGGQAWGAIFMGEAALSKFLKPNTTYTISYDVECISVPDYDTTSGDAYGFSLARSDGSGTELSFGRRYEFLTAGQKVHISKTLTTSDDVSGLVMKIYTNRYLKDGSGVFSKMSFTNVQIEEASTATDYEESKRETAEIPFTLRGIKTSRSEIGTHTDANGQMWIADELHIRADGTGKFIQRIGTASTETLASKNWPVYGTHTYQLFGATGFNDRNKRVAFINTVMSNVLSVTPNGQSIFSYADTAAGNIGFNGGDSSYHILHMTIPDQSITTNEQVRQWIRDHGLEVIYGIEPIETELTAQQVKALLLKTFYPVSNIYNNKNADMEITYAVDTKTYIDHTAVVVDALQSQIDAIMLMLTNAVSAE